MPHHEDVVVFLPDYYLAGRRFVMVEQGDIFIMVVVIYAIIGTILYGIGCKIVSLFKREQESKTRRLRFRVYHERQHRSMIR
jgi:hypothetical protein